MPDYMNEATIRKYIQDRERNDIMKDKLSVKKYAAYRDWQSPLGGGFLLETDADRWARERTLELVDTVRYAKELP